VAWGLLKLTLANWEALIRFDSVLGGNVTGITMSKVSNSSLGDSDAGYKGILITGMIDLNAARFVTT